MKRVNELDEAGLRVLRRLYLYRDRQARRMDRPAYKVIPDDVLVEVAAARPANDRALDALLSPRSALRRRHGRALLDLVGEAIDDDEPLPKTSRRTERSARRPDSGPGSGGGRPSGSSRTSSAGGPRSSSAILR